MQFDKFCALSHSGIDSLLVAASEARWRQRISVHPLHLLLGLTATDIYLSDALLANGVNWEKMSPAVDDALKPILGTGASMSQEPPNLSSELEDVLQTASKLAESLAHEKIMSDHLLLALTDCELVQMITERWGLDLSQLEEQARKRLTATPQKATTSKQYKISFARANIEIASYREHHSKTLLQKSLIREQVKARHKWEEYLALLEP